MLSPLLHRQVATQSWSFLTVFDNAHNPLTELLKIHKSLKAEEILQATKIVPSSGAVNV